MEIWFILALLIGAAVVIRRRATINRARQGKGRSTSSWRWGRHLAPLLPLLGWTPNVPAIVWAVVYAVLANPVVGPRNVRLPHAVAVGLAREDRDHLGAYLPHLSEDVAELVIDIARARGWHVVGLEISIYVDDSARSLHPSVSPAEPESNGGDQSGRPEPYRTAPTPWATTREFATRDVSDLDTGVWAAGAALTDTDSGQRHSLQHGEMIVGRSRKCDLVLTDERVSRRHVRLTITSDAVTVDELGSTNGTSVNGEHLEETRMLHGGDVLVLGGVSLQLNALGDAGQARLVG